MIVVARGDRQQARAGLDGLAFADVELRHATRGTRREFVFHFHGFDDDHRSADFNFVAHLDQHFDNSAGHRSAKEAIAGTAARRSQSFVEGCLAGELDLQRNAAPVDRSLSGAAVTVAEHNAGLCALSLNANQDSLVPRDHQLKRLTVDAHLSVGIDANFVAGLAHANHEISTPRTGHEGRLNNG